MAFEGAFTGSIDGVTSADVAASARLAKGASTGTVPNSLVQRDEDASTELLALTLLRDLDFRGRPIHITSAAESLLHTEGFQSVFLGASAGNISESESVDSRYNTGVGAGAVTIPVGDGNTAVGYHGLYYVGGGPPADTSLIENNTVVGFTAMSGLSGEARRNLALGFQAGLRLGHGNDNVYIANPGPPGGSENGTIRIGEPGRHSATVLSGNVSTSGEISGGTLKSQGNILASSGSVVAINMYANAFINTSDARLKTDVALVQRSANGNGPPIERRELQVSPAPGNRVAARR